MIAAGLTYEIDELAPGCPGYADLCTFVMETWTRSFRLTPQSRAMPMDAYFPWARQRVGYLLDHGARVFVCRDPDRPSVVFAWICADRQGETLRTHYAYTKAFARGQGLFTALLDHVLTELGDGAELVTYTHDPAKKHKGITDYSMRAKLNGMGLEYRPLPVLAGRAA